MLMKLLESRIWLWINALGLVVFGIIALIPEINALIPQDIFALVKVVIALLTIFSAFLEGEKMNSKAWLIMIGVILLFMGVLPFFPAAMGAMGGADLGAFLNTMKIILGAITFFVIYLDWMR